MFVKQKYKLRDKFLKKMARKGYTPCECGKDFNHANPLYFYNSGIQLLGSIFGSVDFEILRYCNK